MTNHSPSRVLVACGLAVAVGACSSTRVAERADKAIPIPQAYASAPERTEPAAAVCVTLPGPVASDYLVAVAAGNADLAAAAARLRQAEAAARATGATLWPSLRAGVGGSRGTGVFASSLGAGSAEPVTIYQGSLAAAYEVDAWGRLANERAAATLDAAAAQATRDALAISLNATAADTWIALAAQEQLIVTLENQRETSQRFVELTQLRFSLGQAPAQDIGRQKQQLLEISRQLDVARAASHRLRHRLDILAGRAPGLSAPAAGPALPPLPPAPDPGVPAALADARPDVRAARLALEAADRRTASAVAARLPGFSVSADLTSIERTLADLFADALWSVGATAGVSLFEGGRLAANVDAATAGAELALAEYAGTLLGALGEVSDALVEIDSQDRVVANLDAQIDEADKVLALTRDGYRQGQASYLDVLTALLSRQSLARQKIDAVRLQYSNRIALCRALGRPVGPGAAGPARIASATEAP